MVLKFRIRGNDVEGDDWGPSETRYRDFLEGSGIDRRSDLWRFFAEDFFHDGTIAGIHFSDDMKDLRFRLDCPNIQILDGSDQEWHYASAGFTCTFQNVVTIQMEARRSNRHNDPLESQAGRVEFLHAEVDTLDQEIRRANHRWRSEDRTFHSIIIKTAPWYRAFALVFERVRVEPMEPLAFEQILRDPGFRLPGYNRS